MKLKIQTIQSIDLQDWDNLVVETYGRPYSLQQQDGCKDRGLEYLIVPYPYVDDYEDETITEEVNGEEMGVSFAAWLARDPKQPSNAPNGPRDDYDLERFWERNFYPSLNMVADDLHNKGLLPAGEYQIVIDW
jgi:hypothetical protein